MSQYKNWWEEKRSAYLYKAMAEAELNHRNKKLFSDLEYAADKQASVWEKKIKVSDASIKLEFKPDLRSRIVAILINILGTNRIQTILSAMKIRGMSVFSHEIAEHRHVSLNSSSNLRAAIFGINDGLVSNLSLILGIAGARSDAHTIVIAGVAGMLAGAFSMGAGEYISVRSQREVFEYQIAIERQELEEYPEEEMEELSLIYQARGIPEKEADHLAQIMIKNPQTGLKTLAREELGINPDDLISPIGAMISSFVAFSVGAVIPLIPFLADGKNPYSMIYSISFTGLTLFIIGALISLYTNRNPIISGLRMFAIAMLAGAVTYSIGSLLGVKV